MRGDSIKRLLRQGQYLLGEAVRGIEMRELGISQMPRMIRAAAVLIFLVLMVTLPSAAMPFVFMVTIGAAYAYNMAISHALGQKVPYLTSSVAAAMQLGVTMDYCVFLMHSFHAQRKPGLAGEAAEVGARAGGQADAETAMERAITRTVNAILSSALTTVVLDWRDGGLPPAKVALSIKQVMMRGLLVPISQTQRPT